MYCVGIDIGTSSIKVVLVNNDGVIVAKERRVHSGSPLACLAQMLSEKEFDSHSSECDRIVLTGSGANLAIANCEQASFAEERIEILEDVPALTKGVRALEPAAQTIVSMGAQSTLFVSNISSDCAPDFAMNENCAAGTGSFFEDQMERLGLSLDDYSKLADKAATVPRLSGRCSVFAKTDIIHRQQEGVPVEDILQGLCHATVKAFRATIVRGKSMAAPVVLAGGTLLNSGVVRAFRDVFELKENELIVSSDFLFAQALGAALHGLECEKVAGQKNLLNEFSQALLSNTFLDNAQRLLPLPKVDALVEKSPKSGYQLTPFEQDGSNGPLPVALGIDVGSTSTNIVVLGLSGELYDAQYLRTRGNPKQTVKEGLQNLVEKLGSSVSVVAVGVTGSGRNMIGELVGADAVRDEITAQARGAVAADSNVETVFEIGGQDSKYISISDGRVTDFQMNKVCAAGTGSFIEEQAARLDIKLSNYGKIAFSSTSPVDLGERCTVFVETAINTALAKGASKADIASGLCLSVVRNYLHKVVNTKPIGKRIVLQGGVAFNPAIVSAFYAYAGDALTVSPWFAVSGAVGVGLLALESQGLLVNDKNTVNEDEGRQPAKSALSTGAVTELTSSVLGNKKKNQTLPSSAFKGWDLRGASTEHKRVDSAEVEANRAFFHKIDELYEEDYTPEKNDPQKLTVGIPRALMLHKLFPMANAFFKALGFNVYLSSVSDEETIRLSQQCAQGETCYPVKLVHGHMAQLVNAGVDYVFMPRVHTIRHAKSTVDHNYACPYMQTIPQIVADELEFERRGITLLSPVFDMDFGQSAMAKALLSVGEQLGKTPQESARAMLAGGFAVSEFTRKTEALGDELLASLKPGERVFVLVTRNYGIVDPALNMGIPDMLLDRGCKVITVSHLHAHDLSIEPDYPDMYWPFGQHMIGGAKLIARDPRMFMIYLTNHGCGPDTMVSHLISSEMGDKPYLQIEMDEHFSKVGVETRVEAFLNAVEQYQPKDLRNNPTSAKVVNVRCMPLKKERLLTMLEMGPFAELFKTWLTVQEYTVETVSSSSEILELGRKETTSKEYLTFVAFLGAALRAAKKAKHAAKKDENVQVLIPGSQGGEADGQYARVIQSILDEKELNTEVVSPSFELLACTQKNIQELFALFLAGDVVNAALPNKRETLLHELCESIACKSFSFEWVVNRAVQVAQEFEQADAGVKKTLALVGEWPLAVADNLVGGMWSQLEAEAYRVIRMPFAEYLLFLWNDAYREAKHEKVVGEIIPLLGEGMGEVTVGLPDNSSTEKECCFSEEGNCHTTEERQACGGHAREGTYSKLDKEVKERESFSNPLCGVHEQKLPRQEWAIVLEELKNMQEAVHTSLGKASPYSGNWTELEQLAVKGMEFYAGAGGRYRFAKTQQISNKVDGVIAVSSLYENTDTVVKLKNPKTSAPLLNLTFDGILDRGIEERLRSFLYYL